MHALKLSPLLLCLGLATGCGSAEMLPTVSASVSPSTFSAGGITTVTVDVENFTLRNPSHSHNPSALTVAQHDHSDAAELTADGGHYHIYLDSTDVNPLTMAWAKTTTITVDGSPGAHTLIIRLNADDHRFLVPEVKATVDITLE